MSDIDRQRVYVFFAYLLCEFDYVRLFVNLQDFEISIHQSLWIGYLIFQLEQIQSDNDGLFGRAKT